MSTVKFPKNQVWKIADSNEQFRAGAFTVPDKQFARYVYLLIINKGISSGNFRVALYTDQALTKLYAASGYRSIAEINAALAAPNDDMTAFWRGRWLFEFPSPYPRMEAGVTYYLAVESTSYTRNALVSYMAFGLDSPFPKNNNTGTLRGLDFELISYRKVRYE